MNENMQQWIAVLRTDEYRKTTGQLRNDNGYCCLGVACDLYRKATGRGYWENDCWFFVIDDERTGANLPAEVQEWLGIDHYDPVIDGVSLAEYNDGATEYGEYSFTDIAQLIEDEWSDDE